MEPAYSSYWPARNPHKRGYDYIPLYRGTQLRKDKSEVNQIRTGYDMLLLVVGFYHIYISNDLRKTYSVSPVNQGILKIKWGPTCESFHKKLLYSSNVCSKKKLVKKQYVNKQNWMIILFFQNQIIIKSIINHIHIRIVLYFMRSSSQ